VRRICHRSSGSGVRKKNNNHGCHQGHGPNPAAPG
jgi:hypothetical protein